MRARMTRIIAGAWLLLLTAHALAQPAPTPDFSGFDHLTLEVSDADRSREFYTRLFGADVWQGGGDGDQYLVLGNAYLRLHEAPQARVTQVGIGVENFSLEPVKGFLDREGLKWQEDTRLPALSVEDRDAVRTRLLGKDSWDRLRAADMIRSDTIEADPIFKALLLDEVGISVTNLEVDSLFYARLLGRTGTLQAGSLWYTFGSSRLRLSQTPVGQQSGVGYFAILISNADLEEAANAVFAAGGIIETLLPNGFSFWDPDGLRVIVHTTPMF